MSRLLLPKKEHLSITSADDPAPYYYMPLLRYPYVKRMRMVLKLIRDNHFNRMLDIGYGSGIFFPELSRRCNHLFGVDIHQSGALVCKMMDREKIKGNVGVADVCDLPFEDDSFECVVCLSVLEFIEDVERAMSEIHRILSIGGIAILGAPVLNRLTGLAYEKIIRHIKHEDQHKSDHRRIINASSQVFEITEIQSFMRFVPLDYALFFCISCRKC